MDNKRLWELTAQNVLGDKNVEQAQSRRSITKNIIDSIFKREPIQVRHFDKKTQPDPTIVRLVKQEIATIFYYIDNPSSTGYSPEGNKMIVSLLKKYKTSFKIRKKEYDKLTEAIKLYRGRK